MDGLKGIARGISVSYRRNDTAMAGRFDAGTQADAAKQGLVRQCAEEIMQSSPRQSAEEAVQSSPRQSAERAVQNYARQNAEEVKQSSPRQSAEEVKQNSPLQNVEETLQGGARQDANDRIQNGNLGAVGVNARGRNENSKAQSEDSRTQAAESEEQNTAQQIWLMHKEAAERRQRVKEQQEERNRIIEQLREQAEAIKKAFDPKKRRNLYDATMDLTLLAQMEKIPALRAMKARLMIQVRSVKGSGAETSEIRVATNKLKKVIGKVKTKIRALEKEGVMEQKRKKAAEAKRRARELALRREIERRKKARKAREQKDIEESKMGLGANYGGPTGDPALDMAMDAFASMGSAAAIDVGAVVDVAVADMGVAAADAGGGAVDVSV